MSNTQRIAPRMTVAEFQDWAPPDGQGDWRWELVDGEPVAMSPPSVDHGAIQAELGGLLWNWLRTRRPDCRVIVTPGVIPRVGSEINERIPDLAVTCGPRRAGRTLEDPVVLVEILSPSNVAKTRSNVWAYSTIPSVREIVIVSSVAVAAEVLRREADGSWPADPAAVTADETLRLESIGFAAALREVYRSSSLNERARSEG